MRQKSTISFKWRTVMWGRVLLSICMFIHCAVLHGFASLLKNCLKCWHSIRDHPTWSCSIPITYNSYSMVSYLTPNIDKMMWSFRNSGVDNFTVCTSGTSWSPQFMKIPKIVTLKPDHLYIHTFIGQFTTRRSKQVMIEFSSICNTEDWMDLLDIIT